MIFSRRTLQFTAIQLLILLMSAFNKPASALGLECVNWQQNHPQWLWCDDFESTGNLGQNYFDIDFADGRLRLATDNPHAGMASLESVYEPGISSSGSLKFSFGNTPVSPSHYTGQSFEDIYWRFYIRTDKNWSGNPYKLTRIISFAGADWSEAAIGHIWQDDHLGLGIDPASGIENTLSSTKIMTTQYNDFKNLRWLGKVDASTQIYSPGFRNQWVCIEARVKLNKPGTSNGIFQLWINDKVEAEQQNLNWRSSYKQYGLNAIFLESYIDGGMAKKQSRFLDNFVVSTNRIGCYNDTGPAPPLPPGNVRAQ